MSQKSVVHLKAQCIHEELSLIYQSITF